METINVATVKPTISIDVLEKIDIRAGTIKLIEDVKGSNKLLKMTVDFGDHSRTILVGMKKEREDPKQLEGMHIVRDKSRTEKDRRGSFRGNAAGHRVR